MTANEQESNGEDSSGELSDDEYEAALRKLAKIRAKKEAKEEGMDEGKEDGKEEGKKDDESSDSDIPIEDDSASEAGDFRLFYSPLDTTHELFYVKTRLEGIPWHLFISLAFALANPTLYKQLDATLSEAERQQLMKAMQKAEEYQKDIVESAQAQA